MRVQSVKWGSISLDENRWIEKLCGTGRGESSGDNCLIVSVFVCLVSWISKYKMVKSCFELIELVDWMKKGFWVWRAWGKGEGKREWESKTVRIALRKT
jgi:hypothetical protein